MSFTLSEAWLPQHLVELLQHDNMCVITQVNNKNSQSVLHCTTKLFLTLSSVCATHYFTHTSNIKKHHLQVMLPQTRHNKLSLSLSTLSLKKNIQHS